MDRAIFEEDTTDKLRKSLEEKSDEWQKMDINTKRAVIIAGHTLTLVQEDAEKNNKNINS